MSLSQEPIFTELKNDFVCGTKDITGAPYSGVSGVHPITASGAVNTTNGAGPHNLQLFVLAQDGTVLTCLPGYWNAEDLAHELELAKDLNKVWTSKQLTLEQKRAKFTSLQLDHAKDHPLAMVRRSQMQGFDKKFEQKRLASSDTVYAMTGGKDDGPVFKTTDVIYHERLAKQPFVPYSQFDVVAFSDYGRPLYNKKEEGSTPPVDFRPEAIEKRKRREQARALAEQRRQQRELRQKRRGG